jgi:hypothetical protein
MIQVLREFISIAGRAFGFNDPHLPAAMEYSAFDLHHLVKSCVAPSSPRFDVAKTD